MDAITVVRFLILASIPLVALPIVLISLLILRKDWTSVYIVKRRPKLVVTLLLSYCIITFVYLPWSITRRMFEVNDSTNSAGGIAIFLLRLGGFPFIASVPLIFCLRIWLYHYDSNINNFERNKKWRMVIDPIKECNNWFVNNLNTFGNEIYLLKIIYFLSIFFSTTPNSINFFVLKTSDPQSIATIPIVITYFILFLSMSIYLFIKFQSKLTRKTDNLGIRSELRLVFAVTMICGITVFCIVGFINAYVYVNILISEGLREIAFAVYVFVSLYTVVIYPKIRFMRLTSPSTSTAITASTYTNDIDKCLCCIDMCKNKKNNNNYQNDVSSITSKSDIYSVKHKKTTSVASQGNDGNDGMLESGILPVTMPNLGIVPGSVSVSPTGASNSNHLSPGIAFGSVGNRSLSINYSSDSNTSYHNGNYNNSWQKCVTTYQGFERFMNHLESEFSMENLLFIQEYMQTRAVLKEYFQSIMEDLCKDYKSIEFEIILPKPNVNKQHGNGIRVSVSGSVDEYFPESKIAQDLRQRLSNIINIINISNGNDTVENKSDDDVRIDKNDIDIDNSKMDQEKICIAIVLAFELLFNKYICPKKAVFMVNIPGIQRDILVEMFDTESNRNNNRNRNSNIKDSEFEKTSGLRDQMSARIKDRRIAIDTKTNVQQEIIAFVIQECTNNFGRVAVELSTLMRDSFSRYKEIVE